MKHNKSDLTPTVYEKHIIVIDGVEHLIKGMNWSDSISQAIGDKIIDNKASDILEYIQEQD